MPEFPDLLSYLLRSMKYFITLAGFLLRIEVDI